MGDNQNDQLKTPAEEDEDLAKVADKPSAPAESGGDGGGQLRRGDTSPDKTADVRSR